jgi:uncharacterized membrane protein YfcA
VAALPAIWRMHIPFLEAPQGMMVGLIGGFASGLLGVSPGGILVPIAVLVLGCEQHVAQGISLVSQIPPSGIAALKKYRIRGSTTPTRWLLLLTGGFLAGGVAGALAAAKVSSSALQWSYVAYLALLELLLILRSRAQVSDQDTRDRNSGELHWAALLTVGLVAGLSSGFMGIGGGLAITVGLSAGLKVPQHQAQAVSLFLSIIPLTIPAALVYWQQGWSASWTVIGGVVLGLWVGTDLGARAANRLRGQTLSHLLAGLVLMFALYMAYKALT